MKQGLASSVALLVLVPLTAQAPKQARYTSFERESLVRYIFAGREVALAVAEREQDLRVVRRALQALDKAYAFYAGATGREPADREASTWKGRTLIAEVEDTCGAGCGFLGVRGIEIMPHYLQVLLAGIAQQQQYDQVLFYELGRNFWFYGEQLEYKAADAEPGSVTTGFAVFMRFVAMDAAGVDGAPFAGRPFAAFRAEVAGLVDTYEADPKWTWETTLRRGKGVPNTMHLGATDLFASFCFRLMGEFGGPAYVARLWREAEECPAAATTADAVDNFVVAASRAAKRDLGAVFAEQWRWPVSPRGRERARAAGPAIARIDGVPE